MKKLLVNRIKRVLIALTFYACCTSVLCCEASMQSKIKKQDAEENTSGYNKHSFDEELTPLQLISLHINSFMQ